MFCPRCRRHLQFEETPSLFAGGSGRAPRNCPVCHTLLAPDRLAPEFPVSEEATVTSILTVQDVLRETSTSTSTGSQAPLDEQVKRFRKSLWEHEHEHDHEAHAGLFLGTRRLTSNGTPALYIALGVASLLAILALVAGIFFHTIWQEPEGRHVDSPAFPTAGVSDISQVVSSPHYASLDAVPVVTEQKQGRSPSPAKRASLMPVAIGNWRLWKRSVWPLSRLAFGQVTPGRVVRADYQNGPQIAEISLMKAPGDQATPAQRLRAVAGGPRTVTRTSAAQHISPQAAVWQGERSLVFDYRPAGDADPLVLTDNPYLPHFPHTISWYQAPYVVTVGADSASTRDSFAQAYLASQRP